MIRHNVPQPISGRRTSALLWLGPMLYMLVVGMYFVGRFQGRWAESDSAAFAQFIYTLVRNGHLVSSVDGAYPNGYAYQAISAFILALTGLDITTLQQIIYPLIACMVVLPAWLLYREWTGSARGATIAAMLLFTQPEFLFVILRSSHEKFTRTLLLLCLYWLTRSFKLRDRPGMFALHVGLFYLTSYALVTSNNLLAHSFVFAVGVALVLAWLFEWRLQPIDRDRLIVQRLPYAILICLGLTYLFTFYAYPPAQHDLLVLRSVWDQVAALLLDVQANKTNPYSAVQSGWISLPVYMTVSIANWLVLATSFGIWARQGLRWLRKGEPPQPQTGLLMWLFYGAFAAQGALTMVADTSGALGGNLQHRIFSSFSIVAVGLVAKAIAQWQPTRRSGWYRVGLAAGMACVALLSVLKATNEPVLSNKWTFYRANEIAALRWGDDHIQDSWIWTEFDERLTMAIITTDQAVVNSYGESANHNYFVGGNQTSKAHDFVVTDLTRLRGTRLQRPLPVMIDDLRVYDNGAAELYHERPQTPYQK